MSYDDPPEPTEEEMEEHQQEQAVMAAPVRIEGLTVEAVEVIVRRAVTDNYRINERVDDEIEKQINKAVSSLVKTAIQERAEAAVDALIAEGFAEFDSYSGQVRKRTSVSELINKAMTERSRGGYNEPEMSAAERAVGRAVAAVFDKALEAEIAKVKADFKKQADSVFQAKIVAGLKEAIGLRT